MFDLDPKDIQTVKSILKKHLPHAKFFVFGSRVSGKIKPHSDLDIAIDNGGKIDLTIYTMIKSDFEESDLPIRIDIVDMHAVNKEFKAIILSCCELLF